MNQYNGKAPPQRIPKAGDRMKPRYDRLDNSAEFQEGNQFWS
jgi:hypothetical protein